MASVPPEENWNKTFNTLKEFHDLAYVKLDEGIKLETEGNKDVALQKYEEGLRLMDLALELRIECPQNADLNWEKACVMLQKLRKTRKEVLGRISEVQVVKPHVDPSLAPPPSYEEAMSLPSPTFPQSSTSQNPVPTSAAFMSLPTVPSHVTRNGGQLTYTQLGEALSSLKLETCMQSAEVICTYENVRIYFIRPDGTVSSPYEPQTLRVLQLENGGSDIPKNYLQAGDWFYPMVPNVSPCLYTSYGAYILPDLNSQAGVGASVGLVFPPDTDETMKELFGDMMQNLVLEEKLPLPNEKSHMVSEPKSSQVSSDEINEKASPSDTGKVSPTPKPRGTTRFSRDLISGCRFISSSLIRGAEKASEFLDSTTPKVLEKVTPDQNPRTVPPSVAKGLEVTKDITTTAANVTGYVAEKIGSATMSVCNTVAPHIKKQGTRLLTTAGYKEEEATRRVEGVLEVAAGCFEGLSSVYDGLGQSASILKTSIGDNTVKIVGHKYGQPMGEAASHTFTTVNNVMDITQNSKMLTFKGMRKNLVKGAGKAVITQYSTGLQDNEENAENYDYDTKTLATNQNQHRHKKDDDPPDPTQYSGDNNFNCSSEKQI